MEKIQSVTTERNLSIGPDISWPKEFPELKLIDNSLRCGICYDYISTCMVTPCAHSYCSICIRKSLLYKTACPTCFEETFETNLRNNRVLDRVTELFVAVRDRLIKHLRIAAVHFNCNEQLTSPLPSQNLPSEKITLPEVTPKRTNHKLFSTQKGKLNFLPTTPSTSSIVTTTKSDISKRLEDILGTPVTKNPASKESDILIHLNENELGQPKIPTVPPMFLQVKVETQAKPPDIPSVVCPICQVNIPERNINIHLDNCLVNSDKSPVKSPVKQKRNPIPKLVWSLMAEKDLRKKLKEYGLNPQGDKKTLISRLQRYTLLYNSECDADKPRPVSEIVRLVEKEEKQTSNLNQQRLMINKNTDPKRIEEENNKYIQDHKDSFKKLIEAMKEREGKNIRPLTRLANRILSDDEDDLIDKKAEEEISKWSNTKNSSETTSNSKIIDNINLCNSSDSNTNDSDFLQSSPILGSWAAKNGQLCNGFSSRTPSDTEPLSEKNTIIPRLDKISSIDETSAMDCPGEDLLDKDSSSLYRCHSSPIRSPSPSCIGSTLHSDSEDSISILLKENDEDFLENVTESITENTDRCNSELKENNHLIIDSETQKNYNSQIDDPDFVVSPEEQLDNDNCSDEVFIPLRKSKRKRKSPVLAVADQVLVSDIGPRRTRRRVNK